MANECKYHEDNPVPIRAYLIMDGKPIGPHHINLYAKPSKGDVLFEKSSDTAYEVMGVQVNSDNPGAALCIWVKAGAKRFDP